MIIDFKARRTTLVASPVDGRSGIPTLTTLAESLLGIPITKGEDCVVFVSRSRKVCKIVFWDERGACMVVRRLNDGRFARFLMRRKISAWLGYNSPTRGQASLIKGLRAASGES